MSHPRLSHPREKLSYEALLALVKLAGVLRKTGDSFFREFGLSQSQFNVLMVLQYQRPEGCSQIDLCQHLLVRPANMTALVRRLESSGWIERTPNPADDRAWVVQITRSGRQLVKKIEPSYYAKVDRVLGGQSDAELKRFTQQLERTCAALNTEGVESC